MTGLFHNAPFMVTSYEDNIPPFEHPTAMIKRLAIREKELERLKKLPKYTRQLIDIKKALTNYNKQSKIVTTYNNTKYAT